MKSDKYKLLYVMLIGDQENTKKKTNMKLQKRRTKKYEDVQEYFERQIMVMKRLNGDGGDYLNAWLGEDYLRDNINFFLSQRAKFGISI